MKKLGVLLLLASAVLLLGGSALAQGDYSYYFVTYYSNANNAKAPDATLRIVNDGDRATETAEGVAYPDYMFASIYVFDDSQELQECCNCYISNDGILSESVNKELLANPLTGKVNTRGVIKVIATTSEDPTNNVPFPGLHGWMTHIQAFNMSGAGPYTTTEAPLADANLFVANSLPGTTPSAVISPEQTALQDSCSFAITLGSGHGVCSCTQEDSDF